MKISASIYAADPLNIYQQLFAIAPNVESFHFDIMDGNFTESYGLNVALFDKVKEQFSLPIDVHLMITNPVVWAPFFAKRGARYVAFNLENISNPKKIITLIKQNGSLAYLAIQPTTPIEALSPYLSSIDGILLLSAPAGGGDFYPEVLAKSKLLPANLPVVIDGKITPEHFSQMRAAKDDIVVMGRSLFNPNFI